MDELKDKKIDILLAEYNTLRNETMAARNNAAVSANIGVPFLLGLIGLATSNAYKGFAWVLALLGLVGFGIFSVIILWNNVNTSAFTRRIRSIEKQINELAGEELLRWETRYGWGTMLWQTNPDFEGFKD